MDEASLWGHSALVNGTLEMPSDMAQAAQPMSFSCRSQEHLRSLVPARKSPARRRGCQLVSFLFDMAPLAAPMPSRVWKQCMFYMLEIMRVLRDSPQLVVKESAEVGYERTEEPQGTAVVVWGSLVAFVERLDDEMFKVLQVGGW